MNTIDIEIFGQTIQITTNCAFVYENLSKDFLLFPKKTNSVNEKTIKLQIFFENPPYQRVPPIDASLHGPGLICYKEKNINYVVYSEGGLLIYDFAMESGELFGKNEFFLYEKSKLTILSRVGELLDKKGLHRIHAFGVVLNQKSLICLLPMEAGKTTTTFNLLKSNSELKIIADDVCFIDHQIKVYPFLLRMGVRDKSLIEGIPAEFISEIHRPYYGLKYFINPLYQKDRLATQTTLNYLYIGQRAYRIETRIEKISKLKCIWPVFESGVFGLGLPQLLEFFVRGDYRFFLQRITFILSRLIFCLKLILKTKTFVIKIGTDQKLSTEKILNFLKTQ